MISQVSTRMHIAHQKERNTQEMCPQKEIYSSSSVAKAGCVMAPQLQERLFLQAKQS